MAFESSMAKFLVGRSRIKYTVLDQLFRSIHIPYDRVVMYIDMSSILYRLYRKSDLDAIYGIPPEVVTKDLVLSILNTVGHYRRYFMTRLGISNDIILIRNRTRPDFQTLLFPGYRRKWFDMIDPKNAEFGPLTAVIDTAYGFIESIVPYFEGIYCMDAHGVDDYTVIQHLKNSKYYGEGWYHLIFSRNVLPTQLVGPDCSVLYNKRDDSYLISNFNLYTDGLLRGRKTGASENLSANLLPFIWCMGGCSDIELKHTKYSSGISDMVKKLNPLVDQGLIRNDMSIQAFLKELSNHMPDHKTELRSLPEELINRHRIVDLSLSARAMTQSQEIDLWKNHVDLFDQNALEDINERLMDIDSDGEIIDIDNLNMSNPCGEFRDSTLGFGDYFISNFSF